MAGTTGLEPATSAVTGQRSDQLSYVPRLFFNNLVIRHIESSGSQLSLFSLFSTISLLWTQFWAFVDTTWTPRWTPNQVNATTESSLPDTFYFWCPPSPLHRSFQDLSLSKPLQFREALGGSPKPIANRSIALYFVPDFAERRIPTQNRARVSAQNQLRRSEPETASRAPWRTSNPSCGRDCRPGGFSRS